MVKLDLRPVGFQFVGNYPGNGGAHVLAHLGADDVDGDRPRPVDIEPDGGGEAVGGLSWHRGAEHGAGGRYRDQEAASGRGEVGHRAVVEGDAHAFTPAASLIAFLIRT